MSQTSSNTTPSELPADPAGSSANAEVLPSFDWAALVPHVIHPLKVAIIESMLYIGHPLSASGISKSFGHDRDDLPHVSYHVTSLAKAGVLKKASERRVRGTKETFYFFR